MDITDRSSRIAELETTIGRLQDQKKMDDKAQMKNNKLLRETRNDLALLTAESFIVMDCVDDGTVDVEVYGISRQIPSSGHGLQFSIETSDYNKDLIKIGASALPSFDLSLTFHIVRGERLSFTLKDQFALRVYRVFTGSESYKAASELRVSICHEHLNAGRILR